MALKSEKTSEICHSARAIREINKSRERVSNISRALILLGMRASTNTRVIDTLHDRVKAYAHCKMYLRESTCLPDQQAHWLGCRAN